MAEREAREVLASIPAVGPVTVDIVVSELGDVRRFRSAKRVAAYAGLVPVCGNRRARAKSCRSPRKVRGCCVGHWWRRRGV